MFHHDAPLLSERELKASNRRELFVLQLLTITPVLYVWSLPFLASYCGFPDAGGSSCFAYRCDGFPACNDSNMGVSVSGFIMTPPATGAMLMTFTWPLSHLRMVENRLTSAKAEWTRLELRTYKASMFVYQIAFSLFVVCTADYFPIGHNLFMATTFFVGAVHYIVLLRHFSALENMLPTSIVLCIAITTFLLVAITNVLSLELKAYNAWAFYIVEAVGLSAMAIFPNVFELGISARGERTRELLL